MATQGGGEHLGTGRIDLAIDTSEFDLGIKRANEQMAGMASGAQEQYAKMNKAERQRIDSLQRQAKTIGLNRQEQLAYNIVTRTTGKVQEDLLRQLQRNTAELGRQGTAAGAAATQFNKYGLSAKQTQAALRQVPAQMTDIFVSLQGGQNPLTVLLQQGGQLKDVFGGVRPAVAALGAQLLTLINPLTVTLGAAAALGAAFLKGEGETNAYGRAIAALGDRATVTVGDLQAMAVGIADASTTQGKAAEALVEVVKSGKIVASQYQLVAEAAVNMERTTGTAISETVAKFAALATDPVDAVAKLNAEEHFLTEAVYQQIKALQQQGDVQGAATLAMETYADAVNDRTGDIEENLGTLENAWRSVTTAAKMAWDAMLDIGREQSSTERIAELSQQVNALETSNFSFAHLGRVGSDARAVAIKQRREEIRKLIRADAAQNRADLRESVEQQANDYAIAQDRLVASTKTADEQRQAKIDRSSAESKRRAAEADKAGLTELAATIRANQEAYEKGLLAQGAKKPDRGIDRSTTRAGLQEFKDVLAEQQAAIKADTAVLRAEYAAKLITQEEYFAASRALAQREMAAQEQALVGQIDFLRNRNVSGKEAIDVQRELGKLEAELAKQRSESAAELKVLAIQEQAYAHQRLNMLDDYTEALDDGTDALREQIRAQIDRIGMGQREFELQQRINQQLREGADEERRLAKAKRDGAISPAEYARQSADNERATRERVRLEEQAYEDIAVAQQDWRAGMRAGLQDWIATASDVASQVRDVTISSLDRIADGFAELAITGKLNWRAMLTDILAELVKFFAKQAVLQFVQIFAQSLVGAGAGSVGAGTAATTGTGASFAGYAAKGWAGTSATLDTYRNTVVNQPTPFYFAKGASFGVMGEAGAEAIMPLSKGPDGTLGVKSYGGGAANVTVGMEFNIQAGEGGGSGQKSEQERAYREFATQMRNMADQQIQRALRPNGTLWKAGVRA